MKLCILTRSLPVHRTGGLETHTWDLARGLAKRGCRVFLLTTCPPPGSAAPIEKNITLEYIRGTKPAVYTPLFFSRLKGRLLSLHAREKFDLVHSEGLAGLTFHPPEGLPLVTTLHGTLFSETPLHREQFKTYSLPEKIGLIFRYRWRILIRPLYRRFVNRCSIVFVDSNFSHDETLREHPDIKEKLRIVPLGIDVSNPPSLDVKSARKRLGLPLDDVIIFTLSRLEKMKGADLALDALDYLKNKNFLYLLGGEGRMREALEARISKEELAYVKLLGRIPENQLGDYFTASDLFIYPEISQPAFGLVSVEAMFHGTPVLASASGAIPEIVTPEVGWTFQRGNAKSLADKLGAILPRLPDLRERKHELRSYVTKHFSLERFIDHTLKVYQEITKNQ